MDARHLSRKRVRLLAAPSAQISMPGSGRFLPLFDDRHLLDPGAVLQVASVVDFRTVLSPT